MAEIAGVVLGGFPLILAAMEHMEKAKDWWKYKTQYSKFIKLLRHEKIYFEETIEDLLGQLVDGDCELREMLENANNPRWRDPNLQKALQEKLPKSYSLYIAIIGDLRDAIQELKHKSGVDKVQNQESSDPILKVTSQSMLRRKKWMESFAQHGQRIKFGFGGHAREVLLTKIEKYNVSLRHLLRQSEKLAPSRNMRQSSMNISNLKGFWRYANDLFNILANVWCNDCKGQYRGNIFLQHHMKTIETTEFAFSLMISSKDSICPAVRISKWRELAIKLLGNCEPPQSGGGIKFNISDTWVNSTPTTPHEYPIPRRSGLSLDTSKSRKAEPLLTSETNRTPPQTPSPQRNSSCPSIQVLDETQLLEITNFCTEQVQIRSTQARLLKGEEYQYKVHTVKACPEAPETTSLRNLLEKDILDRQKRYFLALVFASSHLQLFSTPWLDFQWSLDDIYLLPSENFQNPYLSRPLSIQSSSYPGLQHNGDQPALDDHGVGSLGILLLELCFGYTVEEYKSRQQLPAATHKKIAALQWLDDKLLGEAGKEWAGAVRWCLMFRSSYNKDKGGWKEQLFEEVIEPLKRCYQHLAGDL
ncbi:hypothetical protein EDC01DRAFT_748917 [Geopyxis carbonaria]|nr:hypothetical protein EDC01DRAFT_748917 [Geopyxis carbonaria]